MSKLTWRLMENSITLNDKLKLIKFILSSKYYTNGEKVKQIEKEWNSWLGCKYSLFVSSGSTANFLLISAIKELYKLKNGDKVLVPSCTWMTNVAPIIQLGLTPIFCDIQLSDFSFDQSELEYISKVHPDIKLIFITHLLGFCSDTRNNHILQSIFPDALIIDDVCESHGCKTLDGRKIGSESLGATFSTYFGHHLTSIEGGFVSTNNFELYDLMKMKRSHGLARESVHFDKYAEQYPNIDKTFLFITDGYNFRNTELAAVLCSSQLKKLDSFIHIRDKNFKYFCNLIQKYENKFYPIKYSNTSSNFSFPIILKDKELKLKLQKLFDEYGVEHRPVVSGNLLKHPFLTGYSVCSSKKDLTVDLLHNNGLYIGNNQFINKSNLILLDEVFSKL